MNDHKEAEQAKRDKLVKDYLRDVGATKCPPAMPYKRTESGKLTAADRVFKTGNK